MRRADVAVALLIALAVLSVSAQERIPAGPPANAPTFDVVSIKRVTEVRSQRSVGERPGGQFVLSGMAIAPAIRSAYPADTSDLVGAPDWVLNEVYDLTAKAASEVTREQMTAMLQTMLVERRLLTEFRLSLDAVVQVLRGRDKVLIDAADLPGKRHLLMMDPDSPRLPPIAFPPRNEPKEP